MIANVNRKIESNLFSFT